MKWILTFTVLHLLASPLLAKENKLMREALNNYSSEMTECAAFYTITQAGMPKEDQERFDKAVNLLMLRSREINPEKTVLARYELYTKGLLKDIDNNMENISILLLKFLSSCKLVIENPEGRIGFWAAKVAFEKGLISKGERDSWVEMTKTAGKEINK